MHNPRSRLALICALCVAAAALVAPEAEAQSNRAQRDLVRLSEILGSLHYLRGNCVRSERNEWQRSFERLLVLQNPSAALKKNMNGAFNNAYNYYHRNYPTCDPVAARVARDLARDGERLSKSLLFEY